MKRPWLIAALVVAGVHVALGIAAGPGLWDGFVDGDSYLRVMRTLKWLAGGGWHDDLIPRANAPFGFVSHWTRPFDLALAALAAPLVPFLGLADGLHVAGIVFSPVVHVLAALALAWAARPILGANGAAVAAAATVAQVGIMKLAGFGIADHHFLFILLTTLALGFGLRALMEPRACQCEAAAAGLLAALGLWLGTEMMVFLGLLLAVLGLAWVAGVPRTGKGARRLTHAFMAGVAVALSLDRGSGGLLLQEHDRISVVHLFLAVLLALSWTVMTRWEKGKGPAARLGFGLGAAGGVAAAMIVLFPKVLKGPEVDIDPLLFQVIDRVEEYGGLTDAGNLLGFLGSALIALPVALWKLRVERGKPAFWGWLLVLLAMVAFGAFTQRWVRWAPYAGLFFCIPLAEALLRLDAWAEGRGTLRLPLKAVGGILILIGPLAVGGALLPEKKSATPACSLPALAGTLHGMPVPETILASGNIGPELIYRTAHSVVATIHHRNEAGILDSIRILRAPDPEVARRGMARRGVTLIALCPTDPAAHFVKEGDEGRPELFYRRLLDGKGPDWTRLLPGAREGGYRLFEVLPTE